MLDEEFEDILAELVFPRRHLMARMCDKGWSENHRQIYMMPIDERHPVNTTASVDKSDTRTLRRHEVLVRFPCEDGQEVQNIQQEVLICAGH